MTAVETKKTGRIDCGPAGPAMAGFSAFPFFPFVSHSLLDKTNKFLGLLVLGHNSQYFICCH